MHWDEMGSKNKQKNEKKKRTTYSKGPRDFIWQASSLKEIPGEQLYSGKWAGYTEREKKNVGVGMGSEMWGGGGRREAWGGGGEGGCLSPMRRSSSMSCLSWKMVFWREFSDYSRR